MLLNCCVGSWAASKPLTVEQQVCNTGRLDPGGAAPTTHVGHATVCFQVAEAPLKPPLCGV